MWNVSVYYDYLDAQFCEMKEYVFQSQEMVDKFRLRAVETHAMVFISPCFWIYACHSQHHYFETVQDALDDLCLFLDRDKRSSYKHKDGIRIVSMDYLHFLIYRSECVYLEEENKMLRQKLEQYEKKNEA